MAKLLFVSNKDNNFYNFRREVIMHLKEDGHEVVLVCPYGKKIDFFSQKGCRFVDLSIDRRGMNIFKEMTWIMRFRAILQNERPDLVLTYTTKASIYAGMVCSMMKIPYIVNNAGLLNNDGTLIGKVLRVLYYLGYSHASCMMYQNSEEQGFFNKLLKKKVPYRLLPGSGVNVDYFSFAPYPEDDKTLVFNYVSRIEKDKGIEEFLKCAEIICGKYNSILFRVFGDYDDLNYKEGIDALVMKGVLQYMGTFLDIRPFIKSCHAVIHPSYHEGMTNVTLEHGAMGRPALGSNVTGVKDTIDDGITGYVFEVKSVESMADAVERFINLPYEKKVAMGKAARRKMENMFNREVVYRIYRDEIARIV